jgi:hypothetical protein
MFLITYKQITYIDNTPSTNDIDINNYNVDENEYRNLINHRENDDVFDDMLMDFMNNMIDSLDNENVSVIEFYDYNDINVSNFDKTVSGVLFKIVRE